MLILGIESSTAQVGCAIGGHEGVLASAHSARGKRHAENLTPQIDFVRIDLVAASDDSSICCVVSDGVFDRSSNAVLRIDPVGAGIDQLQCRDDVVGGTQHIRGRHVEPANRVLQNKR